MNTTLSLPQGVEITGELHAGFETILTPDALAFLADLHRTFNPHRKELLADRTARQLELGRRSPHHSEDDTRTLYERAPPPDRERARGVTKGRAS